MNFDMSFIFESLNKNRTSKWFLLNCESYMNIEMSVVYEPFTSNKRFKSLFFALNLYMNIQMSLYMNFLPQNEHQNGFSLLQIFVEGILRTSFSVNYLPENNLKKWLFSTVNLHVSCEISSLAECFTTNRT